MGIFIKNSSLKNKKLLFILFTIVVSMLCLTGCIESNVRQVQKKTKQDLTAHDYAIIDTVYDYMGQWDVTAYDSGENHNINKIAFYKFTISDEMSFYVNYPITAYYGKGYFVSEENMSTMSFSVYETEETSLYRTFLARTSMEGTNWNSEANDSAKYDTIVDAYLEYLN